MGKRKTKAKMKREEEAKPPPDQAPDGSPEGGSAAAWLELERLVESGELEAADAMCFKIIEQPKSDGVRCLNMIKKIAELRQQRKPTRVSSDSGSSVVSVAGYDGHGALLKQLKKLSPSTFCCLEKEMAGWNTLDPILKVFVVLVMKESEETHVDFKRQFDESKKLPSLRLQVVAMYNALNQRRYRSLTQAGRDASYLVYGVGEQSVGPRRSANRAFFPTEQPEKPETIQDAVRSGTKDPSIRVTYHVVHSDGNLGLPASRGNIRPGYYGIIEVPFDPTHGPARYRSSANEWEICSRNDARNISHREIQDSADLSHEVNSVFHQDSDNLLAMKRRLEESKAEQRFRVLILTRAADLEGIDTDTFMEALGNGKFNLIIDLDRDGRKRLDALLKSMTTKYEYFEWNAVVGSQDTASKNRRELVAGAMRRVLGRQSVLVVQGRGCSERKTRGANPNQLAKAMMYLFDAFFEPGSQHMCPPPFLLALLLNQEDAVSDAAKYVEMIHNELLEAYKRHSKETEGQRTLVPQSIVATVRHTDRLRALGAETDWSRSETLVTCGPCGSIATILSSCLGRSDRSKSDAYLVPIAELETSKPVPRAEFEQFEGDVIFMHERVGEEEFKRAAAACGDEEEREIQVMRDYHKGHDLTMEALYLQDRLSQQGHAQLVFAHREQMKRLTDRLTDLGRELELKKHGKHVGQGIKLMDKYIPVPHEKSGGGTTVALAGVWPLRTKYPCLVAKGTLNKEVQEAVEYLIKVSNSLPIILIVDLPEANVSPTAVHDFPMQLKRGHVIIVHVQSILSATEDVEVKDLFVPRRLSGLEPAAFERIYKKWYGKPTEKGEATDLPGGFVSQASKVKMSDQGNVTTMMFGLQSFLDHKRVGPFIKEAWQGCSPAQQDILLFVGFCCYHAGMRWIPKSVMAVLLGANPRQQSLETRLGGLVTDILLSSKSANSDQTDWGMRTPVISVADHILNQVESSNKSLVRGCERFTDLLLRCCTEQLVSEQIDEVVRQLLDATCHPSQFDSYMMISKRVACPSCPLAPPWGRPCQYPL